MDTNPSDVQRRYFERADTERFRWMTNAPGVADTEDTLLAPLADYVRGPCLEIGCGEGSNLARFCDRAWCVGIDRFVTKLAFAAVEVPAARYAAADAAALPFRDGTFQTVFIRDLLHHVPLPALVLAEAVRLLVPGGHLVLLEPNGRNPIVRLHSLLVPAEKAAGRSGAAYIEGLLRPLPLTQVTLRTAQPLPLRRMILHYRFGVPPLGRWAWSRRALTATEQLLGGLLPRSRWAYVAATAQRS